MNLDVRHVSSNFGHQFFNGAGEQLSAELLALTTAEFSASYSTSDSTRMTARVTNLFDKDYQESWTYFADGRTEKIYLLKPDLMLAGAFSTRAATDMLQRLGVPVVGFNSSQISE